MSNLYQTVSEIRAALQQHAVKTNQQLGGLADDYADACGSINERLATCLGFLHAGFRSEAVRRCEQEPKLLDAVARLDFPERSHWIQYCRQESLATPPELMLDAAIELNEAYTIEEQLAPLTSQFRRLNLARSPIADRISVVRMIIKRDPHTMVWRENLRVLTEAEK